MDPPHSRSVLEEVKAAFRRWDPAGDGQISKSCLERVLLRLVPELTPKQRRELIDGAPRSGQDEDDSQVLYDAWIGWLDAAAASSRSPSPPLRSEQEQEQGHEQEKAAAAAAPSPASASASASASTAALRVVQITDVYTLENFPSLRRLIADKRAELEGRCGPGAQTLSVLTGDFLMPYLLSSVDHGRGMMRMLNETPIDYLTWGNHEDDLAHADVCDREREYRGTWLNTNMTSHESFSGSRCQKDFAIVEVKSADGSNVRRVGLIAVLSDEPCLYKPGAFGGAKIQDPWETMAAYKRKLEVEHGCDLVLPLCHLYEPQDERTAREFDFPVILSGHDHHIVDRVVEGTRILKPGSDSHQATLLDVSWPAAGSGAPCIEAKFLRVADWEPDERLAALVQSSYAVLDRLRFTQLVFVPERFRPLSSAASRSSKSTAATFFCSEIRDSLNLHCIGPTAHCELVLINGGNFRGARDYAADEQISLEALRSELDESVEIVVAKVPGDVLKGALRETWTSPGGAWMHYDDAVEVDAEGFVVSIGGAALDVDRIYRVGTTARFGIRLSPSIAAYFAEDPLREPHPDTGIPVQALLMSLFAERAWVRLHEALDANKDGVVDRAEMKAIGRCRTGLINREELMRGMQKLAGFKTFEGEYAMVDVVMEVAGDLDHDHVLTEEEINSKRRVRVEELIRLRPTAVVSQHTADELLGHESPTAAGASRTRTR